MFSSLKTWFGGGASSRAGRPSVRPRLEVLEGRLVPSTLTVSNTLDYASPPGSLRAAVKQADADAQRGVSDTIVFANSLQGKSIYLNTPLELTAGPGTITINGNNTVGPTITGLWHAFDVSSGTVHMNGVVFKNFTEGNYGGAIYNDANLILYACDFDNNSVRYPGFGGAIYNKDFVTMSNCTFWGNYAPQSGGAIYNDGTANVYECTFSYNSAGYGGAIYNDTGGTLYVLSTYNEFDSNKSLQGAGGAIYNGGYATIVNAFLAFNTAAASGGAIANFGNIYVSNNITFYRNHANYYGGGFYDAPNAPWYVYATWNGNTAGVRGPNYYISGGKVG